MKGELEDWYGRIMWIIIIVVAICLIFLFTIKPQIEYQLKVADFEKERDVFLMKFCQNMGFNKYKIKDFGKYNAYCYTETSSMARTISYLTYDYEITKDGHYSFKILQER